MNYTKLFDAFVMVDNASMTLNGNEAGEALRAWAILAELEVTVMPLARMGQDGRLIQWDCLSCTDIHVHMDPK